MKFTQRLSLRVRLTLIFLILASVTWLLSSFVNAIAGMMLTWVFLYEIFSQCQRITSMNCSTPN